MDFIKLIVFVPMLFVMDGNKSYENPNDACDIYGRIKIVESAEDYRVRIVTAGEHVRIKYIDYGERTPGLWRLVESGENYRIKIVTAGEHFRIREVTAGYGCR